MANKRGENDELKIPPIIVRSRVIFYTKIFAYAKLAIFYNSLECRGIMSVCEGLPRLILRVSFDRHCDLPGGGYLTFAIRKEMDWKLVLIELTILFISFASSSSITKGRNFKYSHHSSLIYEKCITSLIK